MKAFALPLIWLMATTSSASAQCGESNSGCSLWDKLLSNSPSPWNVTLTQTVDYGTNLTLPIGLTPANTLLSSGGGTGSIINNGVLGNLGLLDNVLGGSSPPVVDSPTAGGFQDDWMFRSFANVQYLEKLGDDGQFTLGYGLYENLHAHVEQLDLLSHTLSAQYAQQLNDDWTAALNYSFVFYELDHDSLVSQNNAGLGLAYRPTRLWSYNADLGFTDSNFRGIDSLDAQFWSGKSSITRYFSESQTSSITGGAQYGYWNARAETFSYDLHSVFANVRKSLDKNATTNLDVGASWGNYGFRGLDFIQQDRRRDDDLYGVSTTVSKQLGSRWTIFAMYLYTNSSSNVVRQDYASSFVSTGVTLKF